MFHAASDASDQLQADLMRLLNFNLALAGRAPAVTARPALELASGRSRFAALPGARVVKDR